ncbi:hypothetical protein PIB30_092959 [Stylosanthes scabra]|uniref:Putative plant transposon protein domain-containing protein n=1 Tax=Stylosanthes scabra TaxID=79078 RepID=A0ABU6ZTM9_9FABA|nr:hypothetical protein [Stylosanthes scabra]
MHTHQVPRFKSPFHEAHFKGKLSARKVLPEVPIDLSDDILSPCAIQIRMRKWEKFTVPLQDVGRNLVKEFYANAWEPDKAKRKPYTYTTMVQGIDISFAPRDIKRVLKLKRREWVLHKDGRPHYLRRNDLEPMAKGWYDFVCRSILPTTIRSELTVERAVLIHSIIIGENINVEEIIADQFYKQEAPPPQQPPQVHPQPQAHQQQEIPPNFYTHFDASMSQIYRRLDQQQEESRKSFEAINTRMDRMDDQLSFLCYSNQMVNETMYYPYQNIARQFREMEAQGVPVTIANLAIHRHREEEINRERMRHNQTVQEAASQRVREANKGKAREVVPDSEEEESEEMYSSPSEEWKEAWVSKSEECLSLDNLSQLVRDCRLNTYSKEPPCNRAFKVKNP